jgi:hypothetical protein
MPAAAGIVAVITRPCGFSLILFSASIDTAPAERRSQRPLLPSSASAPPRRQLSLCGKSLYRAVRCTYWPFTFSTSMRLLPRNATLCLRSNRGGASYVFSLQPALPLQVLRIPAVPPRIKKLTVLQCVFRPAFRMSLTGNRLFTSSGRNLRDLARHAPHAKTEGSRPADRPHALQTG